MNDTINSNTIDERIGKALDSMVFRWAVTLFCIALFLFAIIQSQNDISPKFISEPQIKVLFLSLHFISMVEFANICLYIFGHHRSARYLPLEKPFNGTQIALKALSIPFLPINILFMLIIEYNMVECYGLTLKIAFD